MRCSPATATPHRLEVTPSTWSSFTTRRLPGTQGGFAADIERIAGENEIEVVLPMFECSTSRLSTRRSRPSPGSTRAISDPRPRSRQGGFKELCDQFGIRTPRTVLAHSGDELREAIGRFPRYFARAAFSRGGVGLLTNTGPLAGHLSPQDCHPTEANPWLVQEFVDGPMHCTYSALHGGGVASHMSYRAPRQWEHSTGIQFLSVDPSDTLGTIERLGSELGWDGQMSLDFIETDDGLVMIECNPRPTDGVLLMTAEELERVCSSRGTRPAGPGRSRSSSTSPCSGRSSRADHGDAALDPRPREIPGTDRGWRDALPSSTPSSPSPASELSLRQREQLFVAMSEGITWDGQSIPGLPRTTPPTWRSSPGAAGLNLGIDGKVALVLGASRGIGRESPARWPGGARSRSPAGRRRSWPRRPQRSRARFAPSPLIPGTSSGSGSCPGR
jgi:hypothetical protein